LVKATALPQHAQALREILRDTERCCDIKQLVLTTALITAGICGKNSQPLNEQEKINQLEKAIGATDALTASLERMTKIRKLECVTAIGNETFCA
jgi:hypothetical protein